METEKREKKNVKIVIGFLKIIKKMLKNYFHIFG